MSANGLWKRTLEHNRVKVHLHSGLKVDGSTGGFCWHGYFLKPNGNRAWYYICQQLCSLISARCKSLMEMDPFYLSPRCSEAHGGKGKEEPTLHSFLYVQKENVWISASKRTGDQNVFCRGASSKLSQKIQLKLWACFLTATISPLEVSFELRHICWEPNNAPFWSKSNLSHYVSSTTPTCGYTLHNQEKMQMGFHIFKERIAHFIIDWFCWRAGSYSVSSFRKYVPG